MFEGNHNKLTFEVSTNVVRLWNPSLMSVAQQGRAEFTLTSLIRCQMRLNSDMLAVRSRWEDVS